MPDEEEQEKMRRMASVELIGDVIMDVVEREEERRSRPNSASASGRSGKRGGGGEWGEMDDVSEEMARSEQAAAPRVASPQNGRRVWLRRRCVLS